MMMMVDWAKVTHCADEQTTPVGFEPTRGDPIGLAGRRLNHSAKVSYALSSCALIFFTSPGFINLRYKFMITKWDLSWHIPKTFRQATVS